MTFRFGLALAVGLSTLVAPLLVGAQQDETPKGVNPKDNITKFDLIAKSDRLDGDIRIDSLSFKYDRALDANWGVNVELPIITFNSPGLSDSGIGDVQVRARWVQTTGAVSVLAAGEIVLPTAAKDALGTGKWQLNPVVGAVMALSRTAFLYAGYKHVLSIGGDNDRADINQSQPRVLAAFTSPAGWWVLGDLKYTRDHKASTDALDIEGEVGTMLSRNTALSARVGTSSMDSPRSSTFSLNGRFIF